MKPFFKLSNPVAVATSLAITIVCTLVLTINAAPTVAAVPLLTSPKLQENIAAHTAQCVTGRCKGTMPFSPGSVRRNLALGALPLVPRRKLTRGSNSQLAIPQNLLLADVDGDGISDFLQYSSNKLFASKTDFEKTGIVHHYLHRPLKRVLTGDFLGDNYDQTCVITDDNNLSCYGISTDRQELWWGFTQGSFIDDNEDTIVGDFDGDGRDDVLVYPRMGGAFRMYSVREGYFSTTPGFNQGNLAGTGAGMQIRAGDFNGDGRADVMVVNPWGQLLYYAAVHDGTSTTFWWAFTTNGNFVGRDDQVTVARIDDNATDDVVLRDRVTGRTRFFRMENTSGVLSAITYIPTGQIKVSGNSLLFWGRMHGSLTESGAYYRDDAIVYNLASNSIDRSDARFDGRALTYWWAYTQEAPKNHTGWALFSAKPWLAIKCKFSDVATTPQNDQFYRDLILSDSGLKGYWKDQSYGSWDLSGSKVVDTWVQLPMTNATWRSLPGRYERANACVDTYRAGGGVTDGYVNVISFVNGEGDSGNAGRRVLATPGMFNPTWLAHETGHTFGWGHSYDDTDRKNADWSGPGEYFDHWDIMSAMSVNTFKHKQLGTSGPEMNAPYRTKLSFIPSHRIRLIAATDIRTTIPIKIAALNRPEADGPLMVRLGTNDREYLTIEYRMKSGWDKGIPQATVLVHRVTDGTSYLLTNGGAERLPGTESYFAIDGQRVKLRVDSFAAQGYTAQVTISN